MLECKLALVAWIMMLMRELIDTCWNVNQGQICQKCWQMFRINRYMLECKSDKSNQNAKIFIELIDTCWNVNFAVWHRCGNEESN